MVDALSDLLDSVAWAEVWGEAQGDDVGFVRSIRALEASVAEGSTPPLRTDRRPAGDGIEDTFLEVRPGTDVRFEVVLRNETLPPADYDQVFRVTVRVLGDGLELVTRTIRVTVPRGRLDAGVRAPDAGATDDGGAPVAPDAGAPVDVDAG
jgi:hypothetical protein